MPRVAPSLQCWERSSCPSVHGDTLTTRNAWPPSCLPLRGLGGWLLSPHFVDYGPLRVSVRLLSLLSAVPCRLHVSTPCRLLPDRLLAPTSTCQHPLSPASPDACVSAPPVACCVLLPCRLHVSVRLVCYRVACVPVACCPVACYALTLLSRRLHVGSLSSESPSSFRLLYATPVAYISASYRLLYRMLPCISASLSPAASSASLSHFRHLCRLRRLVPSAALSHA
jgi:hypothetical protein